MTMVEHFFLLEETVIAIFWSLETRLLLPTVHPPPSCSQSFFLDPNHAQRYVRKHHTHHVLPTFGVFIKLLEYRIENTFRNNDNEDNRDDDFTGTIK